MTKLFSGNSISIESGDYIYKNALKYVLNKPL